MNEKIKRKILNYFNDNSANHVYVNSYLFPEKYFEDYAFLLGAEVSLLQEVGELCEKPNIIKENLLIKVTNLENIKILD